MKHLISRRNFLKAAGVTTAAAAMAVGAPAASACWTGEKSEVTILYTNDVHTYIDNKSPKLTYAAIAALKGCQVLLCLNKCDLNTADELYDIYSHSALPVLRISAETGEGLAALRAAIAGKLNAFTGNSGVGKSSVLNRLLPELHLPVGEVSKALGRGRHTTRHVELFALGGGTYVIDTPGFSSFDTEEMDLELKAHLPETFPEFAPYVDQCRFTGCTHTKEKGCRVLQAVKDGDIPASRHRSYLRLYDELKDLRAWQKK